MHGCLSWPLTSHLHAAVLLAPFSRLKSLALRGFSAADLGGLPRSATQVLLALPGPAFALDTGLKVMERATLVSMRPVVEAYRETWCQWRELVQAAWAADEAARPAALQAAGEASEQLAEAVGGVRALAQQVAAGGLPQLAVALKASCSAMASLASAAAAHSFMERLHANAAVQVQQMSLVSLQQQLEDTGIELIHQTLLYQAMGQPNRFVRPITQVG